MSKYFAAHFGSLDNLGTLASMGFNEAGLVYNWDGSNTNAGTASAIHSAGIPIATFNAFNDGSSPPSQLGAAGSEFAGYFQALVSAGWNCIAGEGCNGSVIGTVQNYCTYINYGGIVGSSQGDMYASPYSHPTGGGHGHWDYIETYDNSNNYVDPSTALGWSKSAGAGRLGILIMYGPNPATDFSTYCNIIDSNGCDTVLFWGGYSESSSVCTGLAQQLISHYGAAKGSAAASTTTPAKAGTTAAPTIPIIQCPCKCIWLAFKGVAGASTSQHVEFKVPILGYSGYVNNNDVVILGKPNTEKLQLWCTNPAGKTWLVMEFWPGSDGHFAINLGSDTAEARKYSVCWGGTTPAGYPTTYPTL